MSAAGRTPTHFSHSAGAWPGWMRWMVIAVSTLILCSCRSTSEAYRRPGAAPSAPPMMTGMAPPGMTPFAAPPPLPYQAGGDWKPPGIAGPWPADEYLRDGGDAQPDVRVAHDWSVRGLDIEDAVGHYDTLDGQTKVEASNQVHIYAPRFGAVRVVSRLGEYDRLATPVGLDRPIPAVHFEEVELATTALENAAVESAARDLLPLGYETRRQDGAVSTRVIPTEVADALLPFENLRVIRLGLHEQSEMARLREAATAANTWTHDQAVQIFVDGQAAVEAVDDQQVETFFTVEDRRPAPKLRVIKVASTQFAQPGDEIDFTIRFDNVGGQPMGNVTILDNLTTRLEYVPESAQSSVAARFSTERNEADSLVLRWEIDAPLDPTQGGVVRFRCRVR